MISCGLNHCCADRARVFLLKCKIPLCLILLQFFLATSGRGQDGFLGQYRAVFNTSCNEVWTLSPGTVVPSLKNFTVCIYLKLYTTTNSWTAFVYKHSKDSGKPLADRYELGLTGKHDKLTLWIFGEQINVGEKLDDHTWYQVCIEWRINNHEVSIYIDNEKKKTEKLSKSGQLLANGQLVLGCSQKPGTSSPPPVGMVGELYMFRMWAKADINYTQDCQDGTIIRWRKDNWVYNETAEYSSSLPCAVLRRAQREQMARERECTREEEVDVVRCSIGPEEDNLEEEDLVIDEMQRNTPTEEGEDVTEHSGSQAEVCASESGAMKEGTQRDVRRDEIPVVERVDFLEEMVRTMRGDMIKMKADIRDLKRRRHRSRRNRDGEAAPQH